MKRFSLASILACSGLALFALAMWRASLTTPTYEAPVALARIEPVFGSLSIEKDGTFENVRQQRAFQKTETAQTGSDSEAILSFPDGEQVRILENSVIFADLEEGRTTLIVKAGDLWVERPGLSAEGPLISRNGVRRTLEEDLKEKLRMAASNPSIRVPAASRNALDKAPAPANRATPTRLETLTTEYIQDVMRSQQHSFFKCYGQLLQKNPGLTGDTSVAFTIERTGKVSTASIPTSTIQDPQFRNCLTNAVKRIEFKSFAGEAVETLFPLKFE